MYLNKTPEKLGWCFYAHYMHHGRLLWPIIGHSPRSLGRAFYNEINDNGQQWRVCHPGILYEWGMQMFHSALFLRNNECEVT